MFLIIFSTVLLAYLTFRQYLKVRRLPPGPVPLPLALIILQITRKSSPESAKSGTLITAQLSSLHINEKIFENPETFIPERFVRDQKLMAQVIPFGVGKRSCVGEQIARAELYLVIGNLLLRYDIQPHGAFPSTQEVLPYSSMKIPDKSVKLEFVKV